MKVFKPAVAATSLHLCTRNGKVKVLKPAVAATSSHLCTAAGNALLGDCADIEGTLNKNVIIMMNIVMTMMQCKLCKSSDWMTLDKDSLGDDAKRSLCL